MTSQESLLSPYKSIGLFLDENPPFLFSAGTKSFLAASTSHSFKLYKLPDLKIKLLGPHFPHKIQALCARNESLYIATKTSISRMKYYHIEKTYTLTDPLENMRFSSLLLIGDYLIAAELKTNSIFLWEVSAEKPRNLWSFEFQIQTLIHPMTYLNKILIIGRQNMLLFNIQASETIYDFQSSLEKHLELSKNNLEITVAKQSPNLHVIGLGLNNGTIILYNIQMDSILFKFQQNNPVKNLTFSHREIPLLASSDLHGNINIWELNEKRLFSSLKLEKAVVFLEFLENELILLAGANNAIYQWKYDELEASKFRLIRERVGLKESIKKLRFYGEDGLHILASSNSKISEIRDFSLLNECMSQNFSLKINKSMKKRNFDTENTEIINEVHEFDFAVNRSKDWGTLLSCHKYSTKPVIWSCEDHSILKKRLEFLEDFNKNEEKANFITAIAVTKCGNFGVLGFKTGFISKINLQSGGFQAGFQKGHDVAILDLKVDHYNKCLISLDEDGVIMIWDFYSGTMDCKLTGFDSRVMKIELSRYSALFLLIFEDNVIELWDLYKRTRSRKFVGHDKTITEAKFTPNNRFVISASMDNSLKIWDVISGQLINDIRLNKAVISFDISENGELLASAFINSREINLWHILIKSQPWGNHETIALTFQSRIRDLSKENNGEKSRFYQKTLEQNVDFIENEEYQDFLDKFQNSHEKGFSFTNIPEGKWQPLIYLDLIKEKNKPKLTEKISMKLPFFLDIEKKDQITNEIKEKVLEEAESKSRFFEKTREIHMEKNGTLLDKFLNEEKGLNSLEIFNYMKGLNASQWDFELRRNLMANNIANIRKMLGFFGEIMRNPEEFDIKQVFFRSFLNIVGEELMNDKEFSEKIKEISEEIKGKWQGFEYKIAEVLNLIEIFGKILN